MKLNGEFFAKRRVPASFCLAKKFGEIDPWWLLYPLPSLTSYSNLNTFENLLPNYLFKNFPKFVENSVETVKFIGNILILDLETAKHTQ